MTGGRRTGRPPLEGVHVDYPLGELDDALVTGTRALEIAARLGDLKLRILATSYLEEAHYYRGEYERVLELATDNLAALPADWLYEYFFGTAVPRSVFDRSWLAMSRGDPARRADAACEHCQPRAPRRGHAPPPLAAHTYSVWRFRAPFDQLFRLSPSSPVRQVVYVYASDPRLTEALRRWADPA